MTVNPPCSWISVWNSPRAKPIPQGCPEQRPCCWREETDPEAGLQMSRVSLQREEETLRKRKATSWSQELLESWAIEALQSLCYSTAGVLTEPCLECMAHPGCWWEPQGHSQTLGLCVSWLQEPLRLTPDTPWMETWHVAPPGTAWISCRSERIQKFWASRTCCTTNTTEQPLWSLPYTLLEVRSHMCFFINDSSCFKSTWNQPGNYKALFLVHICYSPLNLEVLL